MPREYSPAMREVLERLKNTSDPQQQIRIADAFVQSNRADVQTLLSPTDWRTKAANINDVAGIQPRDMAAVLVATAMLDKMGVTDPSADLLVRNGDIAYDNCCGCNVTRKPYERSL